MKICMLREIEQYRHFFVIFINKPVEKGIEMLVLSRQRDESIMIGDNVEITIVEVRGDKVRLGISAPREIPVHRREVYDAIQAEKEEKGKKEQVQKQE
jgi:carbon storage regulator